MKKIMMTLAVLMMAVVSANAQHKPGTITIQPKAGLGLAWMSNSQDLHLGGGDTGVPYFKLDKSVTFSALIGGEFEYQISDLISVAAGLNYSLQGTGWGNKTINGYDVKDTRIQLGYINIPVVANFYLFKGFALKTGLQLGFLTNANLKYTVKEGNRSVDFDQSISSSCNKVDLSIPFGASYEFKIPIVIDMRYNLGLTNVFKDSDPSMKNNVFIVTCGYKFEL